MLGEHRKRFGWVAVLLAMALAGQAWAETPGQAVDRIKNGQHSTLPPPQSQYTDGPVGDGMTLENHTRFTMVFYFTGPTDKAVRVAPGKSVGVALVVGTYEVAVEAKNTGNVRVIPFYGRQEYGPDAHYWLKVYLQQR